MRIQTGRGTIPLITLVGIWSISALNALPGLAVSPILGKLSVIFPHSTELDIQMLSSLPSLLIIPFIILSGKLTEKVNEIRLLQLGLVIFALSGILYLLSNKMWQLIAVSALMGIGSGLIVPLSTGLISFLYREIPDEAIWFKFCYYKCNVGISHDLNGISGGGELAFTVCRLSIALDFHRTFRILEKEYGE